MRVKARKFYYLENVDIKAAVTYLYQSNETQEAAKLKLLVSEGMAKIMQEQFKHQKSVRTIFEHLQNQP